MNTFLPILPFGFPFAPIFLITAIVVVFYLWTQYKQKMELIKKGESIVQFDSLEQMKVSNLGKGIIAITLSLGIFTAHLLESYTTLNPIISYITMTLLFFGIGSLIFYSIVKKN